MRVYTVYCLPGACKGESVTVNDIDGIPGGEIRILCWVIGKNAAMVRFFWEMPGRSEFI